MDTRALTVRLPDQLYAQVRQRAELANRTMGAELLDLIALAIPERELGEELGLELSGLERLDDEALWRAARNRLAAEAARRMERLHCKRQREGLGEVEERALAALVRQYERAMLIRGQATVLLKQRGHDVSSLAAPG
jgi:hypothetical protein